MPMPPDIEADADGEGEADDEGEAEELVHGVGLEALQQEVHRDQPPVQQGPLRQAREHEVVLAEAAGSARNRREIREGIA